MGDSMVERIYQLRRELPSRFSGTTEQEASVQDSFKPKHSKTPHFRSGESYESKQEAASSAIALKKDETSLIVLGSSFNNDKRDEHQPPSRRGVDLKRRGENSKTEVGLNSNDERVELQKARETEGESKAPSLPIHGKTPSELEVSPMQIAENGIPIPDSRAKRFWPLEVLRHPHLSIIELNVCISRVIEALKTAVDSHDTLQHRTRLIDYKVHMVGCTPEDSRPSILLFCHQNDKNRLKRLLDPEFLKRIHCRSPYRSKTHVISWASMPDKPNLWIYIFPSIANPTSRFAGPAPTVVSLKMISASSFCGALVECQGRVATVGLTVEIDGIARLLTVDHIFEEDAPDEYSEQKDDDDDSSWDYDSVDEGEEMFSVGPGVLELSQNDDVLAPVCSSHEEENESALEPHTHCQALDMNDTSTHSPDITDEYKDQGHQAATGLIVAPNGPEVPAHRVDKHNELPHRHAYLDWACLELDEEKMKRWSKSYISTDPDKAPVLLEEIGDAPTSHATSVLMISGIQGIRSGNLMADPGCLGSQRRQDMCIVWTLILDSAPGLVPGECGAVVVDKETYKVYGHVVGANALGHAHVVPFRGVLDQIKTAFGTDLVHFPCRPSPPAAMNSRSNLYKTPRSKPTAVPSTSYATSGPSWSTHANAGSFPDRDTDDFNLKYASDSRKTRAYAMGRTGVAYPGPRRPSHDRVIQAASNLPGHTPKTSSRAVAYAPQLNIDGSDESYGGGSNLGQYSHNNDNGSGQASSSYYGTSSSAYHPHSSGDQQSSSYYASTSGGQGSSLYYSHMNGGQGGSSSYYGSGSYR